MNVVFLVNSLIIGKIHAVTVEYARNTLWIWYRLSLQSGVIKNIQTLQSTTEVGIITLKTEVGNNNNLKKNPK